MNVELGQRFTSKNYENIVNLYFKESYKNKVIHFDLKELEWIGIEQFTFLVSWVNDLVDNNIYVIIHFQDGNTISSKSSIYKNRKKCLNTIMNKWSMKWILAKDVKQQFYGIEFNIYPNSETYCELPVQDYQLDSFHDSFDDLFNRKKAFFLDSLKMIDDSNLKYAENKHLLYTFIREFYSNSCQHAYEYITNQKVYFSVKYNSKINVAEHDNLDDDEREHFKVNNVYINNSYIEFNLMDFGRGISSTLRHKYDADVIINDKILKKLGKDHQRKNIDTRVLEYAFQLFTSRYDLDTDLEIHDYVPRGLFIIKDLVKRYSGIIVARSNSGKIIYRFNANSPEVIYRANDENIGVGFPGTSISIILPALPETFHTSRAIIAQENEVVRMPKRVLLLEHFTRQRKKALYLEAKDQLEKKRIFLNNFFSDLCYSFFNRNEDQSNYLICFDFAGIDSYKYDIIDKLVYFISHCPLVTKKCSCIIFNIINYDVVKKYSLGKTDIPDVKPIPCIFPNRDIKWLGVDYDSELQSQLTEIWKSSSKTSLFSNDIRFIDGNVINIHYSGTFYLTVNMDSYEKIIAYLLTKISESFQNEIGNKGIEYSELEIRDENNNIKHNYNNILLDEYSFDKKKSKISRAYLTSSANYQKEFITFIEKLYIYEYRSFVSTNLLFKYFHTKGIIDNFSHGKISKILTVTLSSQLIGKEVCDTINILNKEKGASVPNVKLVPLSNYYDFKNEEFFNEICKDDNVLIVNDVISTGNLTRRILLSLQEKGANSFGVIAIIDSRTENETNTEDENEIICLHNYSIEKHENNPFVYKGKLSPPIWINPILNAPTSMSRTKTFQESILFSPNDFVFLVNDSKYFKVAYFKSNTVLHTYYLKTDLLLNDIFEGKIDIFKEVIPLLKLKLKKNEEVKRKYEHLRIKDKFNEILDLSTNRIEEETANKSIALIEKYYKIQTDSQTDDYPIDLIFYPFMSSASLIEKKVEYLTKYFSEKSHPTEVYPLPRIMTPKGWRFSFPPKFLNQHANGKRALIFDDGSCTGETITQSVDALSFLELKEIIVFSLFGRLEDFQREYFSRVNTLKYKNTSGGCTEIPINTFFCTHFHIPVYTRNSNPFNSEISDFNKIEDYYKKQNKELPPYLQPYKSYREQFILFEKSSDKIVLNDFLDNIDVKLMFIIRDKLGVFDSYRLFREDNVDSEDEDINGHLNEILLENKGKDAFIAVLIHEPFLIETLKRIEPKILDLLSIYLKSKYENIYPHIESEAELFYYLRALSLFNYNYFLDSQNLIRIFSNTVLIFNKIDKQKSNLVISYVAFLFHKLLLNINSPKNNKIKNKSVQTFQQVFVSLMGTEIIFENNFSLLRAIATDIGVFRYLITDSEDLKPLIHINNFYLQEIKNKDHTYLFIKFTDLITNLSNCVDYSLDEKREYLSRLNKTFCKDINTDKFLIFIENLSVSLSFLMEYYEEYSFFEIPVKELIIAKDTFVTDFVLNFVTNFESYKIDNEQIQKFITSTRKFRDLFLDKNKEFVKFIISSEVNIYKSIYRMMSSISLKPLSSGIIIEKLAEDEVIHVHQYFLDFIIKELIVNKEKYAPKDNAILRYEKGEKYNSLHYLQDSPIKSELVANGFSRIRNICLSYGGEFRKDNTDNLGFVISFPNNNKFNL